MKGAQGSDLREGETVKLSAYLIQLKQKEALKTKISAEHCTDATQL